MPSRFLKEADIIADTALIYGAVRFEPAIGVAEAFSTALIGALALPKGRRN